MSSTHPDGPTIIEYAQMLAFEQEFDPASRSESLVAGFQLAMEIFAKRPNDGYLAAILITNLAPEIAKNPDSINPSIIPIVEGDSAYALFTRAVFDLLPQT